MPSLPIVAPYRAMESVPGGRSLAALFSSPAAEIVSSVVSMYPSVRSPLLTHGTPPSKYRRTFREGVPPVRQVPVASIRVCAHPSGSLSSVVVGPLSSVVSAMLTAPVWLSSSPRTPAGSELQLARSRQLPTPLSHQSPTLLVRAFRHLRPETRP